MYDILTLLDEARQKIDKSGYATITHPYFSNEDNICAHTLGLAQQGLPDLVVNITHEGADLAARLLAETADLQIKQGKFAHGRELRKEVFPDLPADSSTKLMLLEVEPKYLDRVFALNKVLLRGKTYTQQGMQIFFPDDTGRFPWTPGSQLSHLNMMARLPG